MQQYKSFKEARKFARSLKLSGASAWRKFKKPKDIHTHPDRHYKNSKWINWMDWLGTSNVQHGNRRYKVNDNYFKTFSHNMAYVLGFWYADGYMNEDMGIFSITQHRKDKYILDGILADMKCNNPLQKHGDNNMSFKIVSHEIIRDIKALGGFQAKSYGIEFPKNIPKKYIPDFIRGLWDADGCITFQKNEKAYVSSLTSASKLLSSGILKTLRNEINGFRGTICVNQGKYYVIHVGVNDTRRLRDYMYKNISRNSLYLKRKHLRFIDAGEIKISSSEKEFLSYGEAQKHIKKLGITLYNKWKKYKKENNTINIPSHPSHTYKNKGWIDWKTFVGTEFWTFSKAKKYVRALKIKGVYEWRQYASSQRRIPNIPSNPWSVYKEWSGFKDWTGYCGYKHRG